MGSRVWGWGLEFGVEVWNLRFWVWGLGCRGLGFRGLGFDEKAVWSEQLLVSVLSTLRTPTTPKPYLTLNPKP